MLAGGRPEFVEGIDEWIVFLPAGDAFVFFAALQCFEVIQARVDDFRKVVAAAKEKNLRYGKTVGGVQ